MLHADASHAGLGNRVWGLISKHKIIIKAMLVKLKAKWLKSY